MHPASAFSLLPPHTHPPTPRAKAVLPLPNVPVYYSMWRAWSHHSARKGAAALLEALDAASDAQRRALAARLAAAQAGGAVALRPGEWPARLVVEYGPGSAGGGGGSGGSTSSSGGAGSGGGSASSSADGSSPSASSSVDGGSASSEPAAAAAVLGAGGRPLPVFVADGWLEEVVAPAARASTPLSEEQVKQVMARWKQDHLLEHFRAAEKRCLPKAAQEGGGSAR
jgi:hypothetical protein